MLILLQYATVRQTQLQAHIVCALEDSGRQLSVLWQKPTAARIGLPCRDCAGGALGGEGGAEGGAEPSVQEGGPAVAQQQREAAAGADQQGAAQCVRPVKDRRRHLGVREERCAAPLEAWLGDGVVAEPVACSAAPTVCPARPVSLLGCVVTSLNQHWPRSDMNGSS